MLILARRKTLGLRATLLALIGVLLLSACAATPGSNAGTQPSATAGPPNVNGFGSAANHVHALLALPHNVLLLATHYGLFRSADAGADWRKVAGGPGQLMDGLMSYALSVSPVDPQRIYVLAIPSISHAAGTSGLYTSADEGLSWKLVTSEASLTQGTIYTAVAGNDTPNEVYIYLPVLGQLGLRVSLDGGQHFTLAGSIPFARITGLLALPGQPSHLLAYGSEGLARSIDGGTHWQVLTSIDGGINSATTAGPHQPIYASGDAGVYISHDEGASFKLVYTKYSFLSLTSALAGPQVIYGKIGLAVYRSEDSATHWQALPTISGSLGELATDPSNATQVYLSLSYPTAIYRLSANGQSWQPLTPKVS